MKQQTAFEKLLSRVPADLRRVTEKSLDIIDRIWELMEAKSWNQRQLAEAMGKRESEISRYLTPGHNMTLKTLAKLEIALGGTICATPDRMVELAILPVQTRTIKLSGVSAYQTSLEVGTVFTKTLDRPHQTEPMAEEEVSEGNYLYAMAS